MASEPAGLLGRSTSRRLLLAFLVCSAASLVSGEPSAQPAPGHADLPANPNELRPTYWLFKLLGILLGYATIVVPILAIVYAVRRKLCPPFRKQRRLCFTKKCLTTDKKKSNHWQKNV